MNDNFVNISSLVHRQIDLMERYHNTVNDSMERIDNCIQELLSLQQGRDRSARRMNLSGINRTHVYPSMYGRDTGTGLGRGTGTGMGLGRGTGVGLGTNRSLDGMVGASGTGMSSPFRASRTPLPVRNLRNIRRNQMVYQQMNRANMFSGGNRNRNHRFPRRRMTLQQFINSTMNSGNPRIPAQENDIMQQTSMISFEDLSGTNITMCPISLTQFDASSNILRINECNHVFDSNSLMRWFREDSRCPLCRYNISNRDVRHSTTTSNTSRTNDASGVDTDIFDITNSEDERLEQENDGEVEEDELPGTSAIIYDISFSIPQLFGRDMSSNQIDSIIDSITSTITNSMNQSLSNYSLNLGDGEEMVVEEMVFEISGNNVGDYNDEDNHSEAETESTSYLEDSGNDNMDVSDDEF